MFGERLKLARKRAGLSLRDLEDRLNRQVSAQAIGKYERGEMMPGSPVLIALARALEVSIGYLMSPMQARLNGVEFRKKAGTTAKDRAGVETEVLEQVERYLMIEAILELDSACWNHPLPDPQRRVISDLTECEALAEQVRAQWNLGLDPIPNLTQLLEQHGIKVLLLPLPAGVDGLTCLVQRPEREAVPCIVVNQGITLERRRLTLAHELGHRLIDDASPVGAEAAAKHFASAFLMPAVSVRQDFGTHRHAISPPELMPVKRGYRVSAAALLVRCERLGILSHSALAYAFQTFARGWRTAEPEPLKPPGQTGTLEAPERFEQLCYRALAEGLIGLPKAAELLRQPVDVIAAAIEGPGTANADHH